MGMPSLFSVKEGRGYAFTMPPGVPYMCFPRLSGMPVSCHWGVHSIRECSGDLWRLFEPGRGMSTGLRLRATESYQKIQRTRFFFEFFLSASRESQMLLQVGVEDMCQATQDSNGKQYADKSGWLWQTVWRPNDCLGNLGCHDVNVRDFSLSYQFMRVLFSLRQSCHILWERFFLAKCFLEIMPP